VQRQLPALTGPAAAASLRTLPLALADVVPYLMAADLLGPADVVDGDLAVVAHRRRNASFSVRWGASSGVFVKQVTPEDASGQSELRLYPLAAESPEPALRSLPRPIHLDADRQILVVELVQPHTPLGALLERSDAESVAVFARLGELLATLHGLFPRWERPPGCSERPWPDIVPWALRIHTPTTGILIELSAANAQLLRIFAKEVPPSLLAAARAAWRPSTLVHHDFKAENILAPEVAGLPRIVDWEFAGWGDPALDVATLLQSLLHTWLRAVAEAEGRDASLELSAARVRCAAFWTGYATSLSVAERAAFRDRAVLLSALRLLQSAYESGYGAPWIGRFAVLATQVAVNIAAAPDRAASELFGLG